MSDEAHDVEEVLLADEELRELRIVGRRVRRPLVHYAEPRGVPLADELADVGAPITGAQPGGTEYGPWLREHFKAAALVLGGWQIGVLGAGSCLRHQCELDRGDRRCWDCQPCMIEKTRVLAVLAEEWGRLHE